ncbi:MAG: SHOCT domain-containing protein [Gammaproteobacteria bacterium]|nr:SHOCT domain-containing protein [Gammaproteobacteria bacterium]MBP6053334.1 SHOCT domain-containing protein [Pseudomonadales bacterium]MBK6585122.1 SHOCT domain-containing protein [Gammaproteobacteria bacterium]MBK7168770.1 SHOCT domain-containing protein [Gammaproteobacteria bacterium]MBK7520164.1 SHOCT domain-containing protein [Gammaproteobacteria bacterium]
MRKIVAVAAVVVFSTVLAGCGGGSTTVKAGNEQTAGQELLDLQKAYESGVISEREYNDAKKKLLKKM